jgi:hypothetical protein
VQRLSHNMDAERRIQNQLALSEHCAFTNYEIGYPLRSFPNEASVLRVGYSTIRCDHSLGDRGRRRCHFGRQGQLKGSAASVVGARPQATAV